MKLFTVDQNKCVFVCVTITANFVYTMMLTPHDDNVQDMSSRIVRQKSNWGTDRDKSNFVKCKELSEYVGPSLLKHTGDWLIHIYL